VFEPLSASPQGIGIAASSANMLGMLTMRSQTSLPIQSWPQSRGASGECPWMLQGVLHNCCKAMSGPGFEGLPVRILGALTMGKSNFSPHLGLGSFWRCEVSCRLVFLFAGSKRLISTYGSTSPFSSGVCTAHLLIQKGMRELLWEGST